MVKPDKVADTPGNMLKETLVKDGLLQSLFLSSFFRFLTNIFTYANCCKQILEHLKTTTTSTTTSTTPISRKLQKFPSFQSLFWIFIYLSLANAKKLMNCFQNKKSNVMEDGEVRQIYFSCYAFAKFLKFQKKGNHLGSSSTICKVGCLMSSVSMAMAGLGKQIDGHSVTPAVLNSFLKAHGGYSGNSYMWKLFFFEIPNCKN